MNSRYTGDDYGYGKEDALFAELPSLPVAEAEAIRDIALANVLPLARKIHLSPDTNTQRFAFWANKSQTAKDGIANSCLAVMVRNSRTLGNKALISVRDITAFDESTKLKREVFSFEWHDGEGLAVAKKRLCLELAIVAVEASGDLAEEMLNIDRIEGVQLVNEHDCDELASRMLTIAYTS